MENKSMGKKLILNESQLERLISEYQNISS